MQRGPSTKEKLLELAKEPVTYTELKSKLGISDPVIQTHLKDLQKQGLLIKTETAKYTLTESGELTLEYIKEQAEVSERHSVVSAFFDAKGRAELSKLDKASLKDDLLRIEDALVRLTGFTELYHGLALSSKGKLFWSDLFEFGKLTRILVDLERFFYEVTSAVGFEKEFPRPLLDSKELVKKNMSKPIEEDELKAWNSATKEQITSQLSVLVKAVRLACTRAKSDFKDHTSLTRAFDIMLRYIDTYWAVLDGLKISYSMSEQPAYTVK
ncbi:MAG: HTH domain-containing protein [Nitrososphaerota archaeon]|jgi:Mn-dependent DtxR family transcriptional regulator|nr:HTH domain-containing protein [Nitrososphaerota archaeon]MDG6941714.1 HTH domain-containing protein [Nitrososphaerota archaeon]MDG6947113.1 HTH domain-containing protein [Nitrososphaerota archaeon]